MDSKIIHVPVEALCPGFDWGSLDEKNEAAISRHLSSTEAEQLKQLQQHQRIMTQKQIDAQGKEHVAAHTTGGHDECKASTD